MTAPAPRSFRAFVASGHLLDGLLLLLPVAVLGHHLHWPGAVVFATAALAIVPLAGTMGRATESLAHRFGAGVGGLLNATFGNAAELIIALVALRRGLDDIVKASLTGSILGNSLLVLGIALLAGGRGRDRQTFDRTAASMGATLLALAAIGLVIPALYHAVASGAVARATLTAAQEATRERDLSFEIAIVLFTAYALSLVFTLGTHRHLYAGTAASTVPDHAVGRWGRDGTWGPVLTLLATTVLVVWMSELLVGAVGEASRALGLTPVFVGVIVVAIIGNAAEHSTAVLAALRDQMDLALNIAVGSSIQIALFVAPLLVFLSRSLGRGPMDLRFTPFEVVSVAIAVAAVNLVSQDGESNWLEGALLVAVYLIIGLAFYFLP
jgi:Ca2+:H+ antiporter